MPYSFRRASVTRVFKNVQNLQSGKGKGEIVRFGIEDDTDTLAAGKLMFLHTDGKWKYVDADAVATGGTQLIAIALGTTVAAGLLVKGYFNFASVEGAYAKGTAFYASEVAGAVDFTAPSAAADVVLVLGHAIDTANVCYFDPSPVAVVIA